MESLTKLSLEKHNLFTLTFAKKQTMKIFFLSFLVSGFLLLGCNNNDITASNSQNQDSIDRMKVLNASSDSANFTSIQWLDSTHQELGKVQQGGVVEVSWKFKNVGNKPLIISNVSASCGCTVADKPEAPIAPGSEGTIKAKFDSQGREGTQRKDVYVTANTSGNSNYQLSFAVEVTKK
jgi:hypothetical protein